MEGVRSESGEVEGVRSGRSGRSERSESGEVEGVRSRRSEE